MIDLEELSLFLSVERTNSTYIDGIQLQNQILIYMSRLMKFTFSINTYVYNYKLSIHFPSNEDIQHSFIGNLYGQVGSYVHNIKYDRIDRCHIYSLPYQFNEFLHLNNSFPGGMFDKVRSLTMNDTNPFEPKFFQVISEDFPFLNELRLWNGEPQKSKHHSSKLIIFRHLTRLDLFCAHTDYAEQFLVDKTTDLPCLSYLCITYHSLANVTKNFTNDSTRVTCAKLRRICVNDDHFVRPVNFDQYFPLL